MSFNENAVGTADLRPVCWYLRDTGNEIVEGLVGYLAWRWLSIDLMKKAL